MENSDYVAFCAGLNFSAFGRVHLPGLMDAVTGVILEVLRKNAAATLSDKNLETVACEQLV